MDLPLDPPLDITLIQVHREWKQTEPSSISHLGITDHTTQWTSQSRIITTWQVTFRGVYFREKAEKAPRIDFCSFKFCDSKPSQWAR